MTLSILALTGGLALLTAAADRSVLSAARLSVHFGLSPVLIGALVIGLGTSIPELVVSLVAADPTQSMGNIVGSNISNLTLVLGSAVLFATIVVPRSMLFRQGFVMAASVGVLAVTVADGEVSRLEGVGLAAAAVAAYVLLVWVGRDDAQQVSAHDDYGGGSARFEMIMAPLALAATVAGAWILVWAAERIATDLGLTSAFVGLVLLAVGTSLPELATALAAARRSEPDLIIGNVIGSNIFNSLIVGGAAAIVHPGSVVGLGGALVLMVIATATAGGLLVTSDRLDRRAGSVLLAGFVALIVVSL